MQMKIKTFFLMFLQMAQEGISCHPFNINSEKLFIYFLRALFCQNSDNLSFSSWPSVIIRIMQSFLDNLPKLKRIVNGGSTMCPKEEFPFMAFLCGYLYSHFPNISDLFSFLEVLQFLKAEGKITPTIEGHILLLFYQKPHLFEQISKLLERVLENSRISVLMELEKINQQDSRIKKTQIQSSHKKENGINGNNLQGRTGTVEMPENTIEMEAESDHTEKYDEEYFEKKAQEQKQSLALAKRLQEEEQMMIANKQPQEIMCDICCVDLYEQEFHPLENCEHIYHINCLSEFYKVQISENRFPLKCPNSECLAQLNDHEIKVVLQREVYEKYQRHTLKFYADMHGDSISWCPTADCEYMFFFEKDDDVRFECQQCHKEYCLNCRVDWHNGMTCKQYKISNSHSEEDDQFMKFVTGKKFKQCPKCKFWVQKNQGCDHMTCKCKFQFCYKCGGVYGKCECVKKFQEEAERRRAAQLAREQKKRERLRKRAQKLAEQSKKEEAAPSKGTRSRRRG